MRDIKAFFALPPRRWEQFRVTALALAVLICVGYAVGLARPEAIEPLLALFVASAGDLIAQEPSGAVLMWAIFANNLTAMFSAMLAGLVPFLRLPALELGMNALLLGGLAAYYRQNGLGLASFLAGTLPHGITELSALALACASGLYLCRAVSGRLLKREGAPSVRRTFGECVRAYVRWILPLALVSAAIETYVTPLIFERFL